MEEQSKNDASLRQPRFLRSFLHSPRASKRRQLVVFFSILLLAVGASLLTFANRGVFAPGKWTLVWGDEFRGASLDRDKWTIRDEAGKYNHELEYYVPSEVAVKSGTLSISSHRQRYKDHLYTSGAIETKGKFFFLYGRAEMYARFPRGSGVWPAFWLLPEDRSWPPEIDVAELLGQEPSVVHMTNYWGTVQDHPLNSGTYAGPDFSQGWHTYRVDWEPSMIRWYVDDVQLFASEKGVPDKPMYLILNTAVGGDFPGKPDTATPFPQKFEIRYIRIWQRQKSNLL